MNYFVRIVKKKRFHYDVLPSENVTFVVLEYSVINLKFTYFVFIVVSSYFGFGLLDIGALVERSKTWDNVPPRIECSKTVHFNAPYVISHSFCIVWFQQITIE